MSVKIRENKKKLYLDIYIKGERKWESLQLTLTGDKYHDKEAWRLAEIARNKREEQIFSETWGIIDQVKNKISLYDYMEEIGKTKNPKDRINKVLPHLKKFPKGDRIPLNQITSIWFNDFQRYLEKSSGLSQNTANSYAYAIRICLNQAVRDNLILKNPTEGVRSIKTTNPDKPHLTPEEIQRISNIEASGELYTEVKTAFLFACFTGLRISDLKSLYWKDINIERMEIVKKQIKTKNVVSIPLHHIAYKIIDDGKMHDQKEPVFKRLSSIQDTLNNYLRRIGEKAELRFNLGWHIARHTFAVLSLDNGADIFTVSKLLGHTDIKTTLVYSRATQKMKREAVDNIPSIEIN